jgi:hypothetical protein
LCPFKTVKKLRIGWDAYISLKARPIPFAIDAAISHPDVRVFLSPHACQSAHKAQLSNLLFAHLTEFLPMSSPCRLSQCAAL